MRLNDATYIVVRDLIKDSLDIFERTFGISLLDDYSFNYSHDNIYYIRFSLPDKHVWLPVTTPIDFVEIDKLIKREIDYYYSRQNQLVGEQISWP